MQIVLEPTEYENLMLKSNAIDKIERLINEAPSEDVHGNVIPYRYDKVISGIMDVLDSVKAETKDTVRIPWFRETDKQISRLFG